MNGNKTTLIFGSLIAVVILVIIITSIPTRRAVVHVPVQPVTVQQDYYDQGHMNAQGVYQQDFYSNRGYYSPLGVFIFVGSVGYNSSYHTGTRDRYPTQDSYQKKHPNKKIVKKTKTVTKKTTTKKSVKPTAKKRIDLKKKPAAKAKSNRINLKKKSNKRLNLKKKSPSRMNIRKSSPSRSKSKSRRR
jgi:hypothetical protein